MKTLAIFLLVVITFIEGNVLNGPCGSLASSCYAQLLFGASFTVCESFVRCEYATDVTVDQEHCVLQCANTALRCEKQYPEWQFWLKHKRHECGVNGYHCLENCKKVHGGKRSVFDELEDNQKDPKKKSAEFFESRNKKHADETYNEFYDFGFDKK